MAKKSLIEREKKREILNKKYRNKYFEIKSALQKLYAQLENAEDDDSSGGNGSEIYTQIDTLQQKLEGSIPRNATRKRLRSRCALSGRPRGVYSKYKLCSSMLRKYAMMGYIPGLKKSSW